MSAEPEVPDSIADTHRNPGQYLYDNTLMLNEFCSPQQIDRVLNLPLEETDVVISSYPKTGTTLLQEIVWLLRNNGDVEKANQSPNYSRVPFVDDTYFNGMGNFNKLESPRHLKTHLPFRLLPLDVARKQIKVVYILRNPRDTLVSYYHFYKSLIHYNYFKGNWHQFFDMYYRVNKGLCNYGDLFVNYREYWEHRHDQNMLVLVYENLVKNPKDEIKKIAEFLGVDHKDEKLIDRVVQATKFDVMKENPMTNYSGVTTTPFMRKGKIGDWRNYFTEDQLKKLSEIEEDRIGGLGLEFIYD